LVFLASSGFNLLKVNPGLVVWTLVTFLLVVYILKKFAWDKILHALEARSEKIHADLDKAESSRKEAEALIKGYQDKLHAATEEVHKMIEEAKRDATNLRNKMLADAQADVKNLKDQASKDIDLAKTKALSEIQNQIVELSVLVAGEILEKQLKPEDHAAFIDKEIAKLGKLNTK